MTMEATWRNVSTHRTFTWSITTQCYLTESWQLIWVKIQTVTIPLIAIHTRTFPSSQTESKAANCPNSYNNSNSVSQAQLACSLTLGSLEPTSQRKAHVATLLMLEWRVFSMQAMGTTACYLSTQQEESPRLCQPNFRLQTTRWIWWLVHLRKHQSTKTFSPLTVVP